MSEGLLPEGKRWATKEDLEALKGQLIAMQPKEFKFPEIPQDLAFKWSDLQDYLQVPDLYVRAHYKFYREIEDRIKALGDI